MNLTKHKIIFDPVLHKYTDETGRTYTSATQLLGQITPEFNSRYWLMYKALQAKGHKVRPDMPDNRYIIVDNNICNIDDLYKSVKGILARTEILKIEAEWEQTKQIACDRGNEKHNYLEDCIKQSGQVRDFNFEGNNQGFAFKLNTKQDLSKSPLKYSDPLVYDLLTEYIELGWTVYAEKRIYSHIHLIAGTIDIFLVKGREFKILDWKTNKDELHFTSGYYKKYNGVKSTEWVVTADYLKKPLNNLMNCKGVIYTLQLSIYAYMAELWGLECKGLQLCHFMQGNTPRLYNIQYQSKDVETLFNWKIDNKIEDNKPKRLGIKV